MSSEPSKNLPQQVQEASQCLRKYLDSLQKERFKLRSPFSDPVRTKNLEKIAGYLQSILVYLDSQADKSLATEKRAQSLFALLEQIKTPPTLSSNNAWELADLFDAELLWFSDDIYLYTQLKCLQGSTGGDLVIRDFCFPADYLQALTNSYTEGIFAESHRLEVIYLLYHLKQTQIGEYRRDRAKVRLRGIYLARMAALLGLLLVGLGLFYIASTQQRDPLSTKYLVYILLLMVFSGATGSVLSRAVKLGKQPLSIGDPKQTTEPPLGIRALLSDWKVFLAQPVIGAATAVVIFLVISSGLLQVGGKELGPSGLALIGFLTGFSEPFFLGTLDKIAGGTSTPLS